MLSLLVTAIALASGMLGAEAVGDVLQRVLSGVKLSMADMSRVTAPFSPRCSRSKARVQKAQIGLATPLPVMSKPNHELARTATGIFLQDSSLP